MDSSVKQLELIFGKVERVDAHFEVYASAKYYPKTVKVFIPNHPYLKKIPFMEVREDKDGIEDWTIRVIKSEKISNESNLDRSIRKTKTTIMDLVLCNEFDSFATFTFSPKKTKDRGNAYNVKKQIQNWFKNIKKRNGKFAYLLVPEFHKDGKSLHFHVLMKNYPGELIDSGKKINGRTAYNIKSYTLGHSSLVFIDNLEKVSYYVSKYIVKDMPQIFGAHRFWASHGLKRPPVVDNPAGWYRHAKPLDVYTNDYGSFLTFERTEESDEELLAS